MWWILNPLMYLFFIFSAPQYLYLQALGMPCWEPTPNNLHVGVYSDTMPACPYVETPILYRDEPIFVPVFGH